MYKLYTLQESMTLYEYNDKNLKYLCKIMIKGIIVLSYIIIMVLPNAPMHLYLIYDTRKVVSNWEAPNSDHFNRTSKYKV